MFTVNAICMEVVETDFILLNMQNECDTVLYIIVSLRVLDYGYGSSLPSGGDLQPLTLRFITAYINLFPTWVCELLNFGTINIVS